MTFQRAPLTLNHPIAALNKATNWIMSIIVLYMIIRKELITVETVLYT